jgi:hypothetical protein
MSSSATHASPKLPPAILAGLAGTRRSRRSRYSRGLRRIPGFGAHGVALRYTCRCVARSRPETKVVSTICSVSKPDQSQNVACAPREEILPGVTP